jgi:hypothetical protein
LTTESWAEEHARLTTQLRGLEAGTVEHFEDGHTGALGTDSSAEQMERTKVRLAELSDRLGLNDNK